MITATESSTLHFPAQDAIVAYLTKHPLTSDPDLTENKIIETVAEFFANQVYSTPMGVEMSVMLVMTHLSPSVQIRLTGIRMVTITTNLIAALVDCAAGKAIGVEKKTKD